MKLQFKELKKAIDYIVKHGDQGSINVFGAQGVGDGAFIIAFSDANGDEVKISLPTDEREFIKLTRTERF